MQLDDILTGAANVNSRDQSSLSMLLVVLKDVERLQAIFGQPVLAEALHELGVKIEQIILHVLAHRAYCKFEMGAARWVVIFGPTAVNELQDDGEAWQSITEAVAPQFETGLLTVFGSAVGSRIEFCVAIERIPREVLLDAANQDGVSIEEVISLYSGSRVSALPSSAFRCAGTLDPLLRIELRNIVQNRSIRTLLQPIVRLVDGVVVGYEALSRGPIGSRLEMPDRLFSASRALGEEVELELLCAQLALERTAGLIQAGAFLTINLGPAAIMRARDELPLAGRTDVLVELTEHLPLDEIGSLAMAISGLRSQGIGFVLDDTGCGFADMETAEALVPDIVKLCITVVRQVGASDGVQTAIANIVEKLRSIGCRVLAEGVETSEQHQLLSAWPIELAQGWLFARPATIEFLLSEAFLGSGLIK